MKCPRCQKEVNDDNIYCPYCGAKLNRVDDETMKELRKARFNSFAFIMNRIMNIATIATIVFVIIGIFGPVIIYSGSPNISIGGLEWFTSTGWIMLNEGKVSIGPFFTTFAAYILSIVGIITLSVFALYKTINSLRKNEDCHTIPHIIGLAIIYRIYCAFIMNFYYEYLFSYNSGSNYESGWGQILYNTAIPLFAFALIIYLIAKAFSSNKSKKGVSTIFALIIAFSLMNVTEGCFACLGFQDTDVRMVYVFGTLHYFDLSTSFGGGAIACIISMFFLGLMSLFNMFFITITIIRNLVKFDKIDRKLLLFSSIGQVVIAFSMSAVDIAFGVNVNTIQGFTNNVAYVDSNLILIILCSLMVLGFSIAIFAMNKNEDKVDESIINQPVEEKEEA